MQNQGQGRGCLGALIGIVLWIVSAFFLPPLVGLLIVIGVGLVGLIFSSRDEVGRDIIRGLSNVAGVQFALLFLWTLGDDLPPDRLAGSSFGTAVCCLVMFGLFGASDGERPPVVVDLAARVANAREKKLRDIAERLRWTLSARGEAYSSSSGSVGLVGSGTLVLESSESIVFTSDSGIQFRLTLDVVKAVRHRGDRLLIEIESHPKISSITIRPPEGAMDKWLELVGAGR